MLLRPVSSPPRRHSPGPAARRSAGPATAPFFLVLRRRQRRRRHRPYTLLRASLPDILASFPTSLALVGPAAAAAAAAVFSSLSPSSYLRSSLPPPAPNSDYDGCEEDAAGEWILFTSPTPFNRSVLLRCPSVSFDDGGVLLDGVNDRLLTEERHYVNLSRGRIPATRDGQGFGEISYQRICIPAEDGGVIALDWPENLDLDKEHGLDSTVLVVPGTTEGSMERGIEMFMLDALKNGYFPIVMNPRGCGGSPLTTPRLFTAADSDDISTTIHFINSKRPWTTMMGVGWGFGANMLTKYLVEVGESTPLTAAVCIDNPFDLQEATRTFPHNVALDKKLTSGLVDILRANKELFQGKDKDFNVQKALSANSLRDFDGAISMVSHGFATVDDFYAENSMRLSVAHVKIPVLFIQSDDGTVPLLSVPRSLISENPFTSLLLCSCVHSSVFTFERYTALWCQNLTLEWLSAVEFALLKGRHPLIKDVDITINPSKGLAFVEPQPNNKIAKDNNVREQSQLIFDDNVPHGTNGLLTGSANGYAGAENSEIGLLEDNGSANGYAGAENSEIGLLEDTGGIDRVSENSDEEDSEESSEDDEKGQVLQSASLVMNMLDATMPGTLDDDQKKKVMVAVEQGESLVKALEEAVPEDVRGRLTTSVGEILQSRRGNFNLEALKRGWTNVRSSRKSVVQEKVKESDQESGLKDAKTLDQDRSATSTGEGDQKDTNLTSSDRNPGEGTDLLQEKPYQTSGTLGTGIETGSEQTQHTKSEKGNSGVNESSEEQHRNDEGSETAPSNISDDQSTANSNGAPREQVQSVDSTAEPNPQPNVIDKEGDAVRANEDKVAHNVVDQSMQVPMAEESRSPSVSVSQALDALTGFDDSTQMAVNSVFGVLENMIDRFQKHHDSKNEGNAEGTTDEPSVDETESSVTADVDTVDETESSVTADVDTVDETESSVTADVDNELSGKTKQSSSDQPQHSISVKACPIVSEDHTFGETNSDLIVPPSKGKISDSQRNKPRNYVSGDVTKQSSGSPDFLLDIAVNSYLKVQYALYLHEYLSRQLQLQSPDLNSATDLFLDPQEGKWKLADQMDNVQDNSTKSGKHNSEIEHADSSQALPMKGNVILPPYSVLRNFADSKSKVNEKLPGNALRQTLTYFITDELSNALKIEVGRKLGIKNTDKLQRSLADDVERLAAQVSRTIVRDCDLYRAKSVQRNPTTVKFGVVHGENVIEAVSTAVQRSHDLRNVLPVGVIIGVTLVSLRNYFQVGASKHDNLTKAAVKSGILNEDLIVQDAGKENIDNPSSREKVANIDIEKTAQPKQQEITRSEGKGMMVGAVTAALGASALVAHHQQKEVEEETELEKSQNNLVSSFAEKAMSVAAPVVPTRGDGEVDHDRLVAVLAELGQRGGILKFVGNIALLWGGIRGAMSLTDRLISFLRISERPLFQRILGFSFMVLVLWSPVVIPLLPTLVQSWTISASTGIVGDACIVGLYVSIMILVMLWGKRIRGYEDPVEQYGMNLTSASRLQEFLQGLVGGVAVVWLVHSTSILLGFATVREGSSSFLARPFDLLKYSSNTLLLALRGFITATSIAVVEEVVFRSWLPEEAAVDLGYYHAILLSGIVFSLIHRSLPSVPGFLLLSLVLFGLKQRTQGNLAAPIGLRSGIMTASYLTRSSSIIIFKPETPSWMISTYHLHPFDGAIGLSICALLAILFFPQKPGQKNTSVS